MRLLLVNCQGPVAQLRVQGTPGRRIESTTAGYQFSRLSFTFSFFHFIELFFVVFWPVFAKPSIAFVFVCLLFLQFLLDFPVYLNAFSLPDFFDVLPVQWCEGSIRLCVRNAGEFENSPNYFRCDKVRLVISLFRKFSDANF